MVKELCTAFGPWQASVKSKAPADMPPIGDTGRKLRVRMATPWLGVDNHPIEEMRGVLFNEDGTALAPDDCWWRGKVCEGTFHLCGIIQADGAGKLAKL